MEASMIITPHVINTIKSLPATERRAIANALAAELLLGDNPDETLSPFQAMLYSIIRYYVKRDTERGRLSLMAPSDCDRRITV